MALLRIPKDMVLAGGGGGWRHTPDRGSLMSEKYILRFFSLVLVCNLTRTLLGYLSEFVTPLERGRGLDSAYFYYAPRIRAARLICDAMWWHLFPATYILCVIS